MGQDCRTLVRLARAEIYPSFPLSCPWLPEKGSQGKGVRAP